MWLHLKKLSKFFKFSGLTWLSCLKVMMDCHFSLLFWAVLVTIWTWSFTKLSSVYHPYLLITQLIGSNALKRKEIPQINFYEGTPVNWNAFQATTSWSWLRKCQECEKLSLRQRVSTLNNLNNKYIFWFVKHFFGYYIILYVLFHSFDVFTIILQCRN